MPFIYHDVSYNSNDHVNIYTGFTGSNVGNTIQNSNQTFSWSVDILRQTRNVTPPFLIQQEHIDKHPWGGKTP